MDNNEVSPQTCVLKMQLNCECCRKEVKQVLKKIHGVHSFTIDANEGTVAVSSTVDPQLFITMLANAGKRAELLWHPKQTNTSNQIPHVEQQFINPQDAPSAAAGGSLQSSGFDYAQLQELANLKGLKHVELRKSKNIKLTFKDHNNEINHSDDHIRATNIILEGQRAPGNSCHPNDHHDAFATNASNVHATKNCSHGTSFACGARPSRFSIRYAEEQMMPMPHYRAPPELNCAHPFARPPDYYAYRDATCGDLSCRNDDQCVVM